MQCQPLRCADNFLPSEADVGSKLKAHLISQPRTQFDVIEPRTDREAALPKRRTRTRMSVFNGGVPPIQSGKMTADILKRKEFRLVLLPRSRRSLDKVDRGLYIRVIEPLSLDDAKSLIQLCQAGSTTRRSGSTPRAVEPRGN